MKSQRSATARKVVARSLSASARVIERTTSGTSEQSNSRKVAALPKPLLVLRSLVGLEITSKMFDPEARVISRVKWPFGLDQAPRGVFQLVRRAAHNQKPSAVPSVLQIMIRKHLLRREESGNRLHYEARQILFILVKFQCSLAVGGDGVRCRKTRAQQLMQRKFSARRIPEDRNQTMGGIERTHPLDGRAEVIHEFVHLMLLPRFPRIRTSTTTGWLPSGGKARSSV